MSAHTYIYSVYILIINLFIMIVSPFRMSIVGPSFSGKTTFVKNLILSKDRICGGEPIKHIVWACKDRSYIPDELIALDDFSVFEGIPDIDKIRANSLLIIEDLMLEAFTKKVLELFTVHSHHKSISVCLILQSLFPREKLARDISINNQYIVVFKNPRDSSSIGVLARQISGKKWREIESIYKSACQNPFSYLLIDLRQETPDILRYQSNIFNREYFETYATIDEVEKISKRSLQVQKEPVFVIQSFTH